MKKIVLSATLVAVLSLLLITPVQAIAYTPASVRFISATTDSVTVELSAPNPWWACFEYRTDGDTGQATGANYNPAYPDLYPFWCINNQTVQRTIPANDYVEIRMVFGAESDERFDWVRFDVAESGSSASEGNPLVNMFVFYSASGFYDFAGGTVNTCTVFQSPSLPGSPSLGIVERLCQSVPADISMPCIAPLYDDGYEGSFACDSFLASVGERRAGLRGDGVFADALLPRITAYLSMLAE